MDKLHLSERVIFLTGKGGTGKTWLSISLAYLLAKKNKNTLLCDLGLKEHISNLIGIKKVNYTVKKTKHHFYLIHIDPDRSLNEYVKLRLKTPLLYIPLTASNIYKRFTKATPGLKDITVIGKVWYEYNQKVGEKNKFEHIVVDMPSTGHAIPMLKLPDVYADALPFGPVHSESKKLQDMLKNDSTLIVVTIPEEMAVRESIELIEKAREQLNMKISGILLNMFMDDFSIDEIKDLKKETGKEMRNVLEYLEFKHIKSKNALKVLKNTFKGIPVIPVPVIKFSDREKFFIKISEYLEEVLI